LSAMTDKKLSCDRRMSRRNFVRGSSAVILATRFGRGHAEISGASVLVQFEPGGRVTVASGSQDLGSGASTIMAQVAAATLHLRMELVDPRSGDSAMPKSSVSSFGPPTAANLTPAVQAAAKQAQLKLFVAAAGDKGSPLHGARVEELEFKNGRIIRKGEPESGESFTAFLARNGNKPLGAVASVA
jgi:xanthine dehydrogenase YagR molybdenum-binding subunit